MYTFFKTIAEQENWIFDYARRDFQNLANELGDPEQIFLFLDPVTFTTEFGDYNEIDLRIYTSSFLLLVNSDFDELYSEKYETRIRPIIDTAITKIKDQIYCNNKLTIESWRTTEIVNLFDQNLDGIIVNFVISIEN